MNVLETVVRCTTSTRPRPSPVRGPAGCRGRREFLHLPGSRLARWSRGQQIPDIASRTHLLCQSPSSNIGNFLNKLLKEKKEKKSKFKIVYRFIWRFIYFENSETSGKYLENVKDFFGKKRKFKRSFSAIPKKSCEISAKNNKQDLRVIRPKQQQDSVAGCTVRCRFIHRHLDNRVQPLASRFHSVFLRSASPEKSADARSRFNCNSHWCSQLRCSQLCFCLD